MVQITTSCRVWKLRYQGGCKEPTSQVDYGQLGRSEYWLINSFRTAKAATDGNHTLCLKSKPQVKCHWSLPARETSEREAHTRRPTNFRHSPQSPPQPGKGQDPDQAAIPPNTHTQNANCRSDPPETLAECSIAPANTQEHYPPPAPHIPKINRRTKSFKKINK